MMRIFFLLTIFIISLFAETNTSKNSSLFFDEKDGNVDISGYLGEVYGFLPVPTVLTEPALGYGAALGLLYLHDNFIGKKSAISGKNIPASISGMFIAATENGSKFGGGLHIGYWKEDTIRTISFLAATDVNINLYLNNAPISSNVKGPIAYQSLKFRLSDTDLFLGGYFIYAGMNLGFNIKDAPQLPPLSKEFTTVIAGLSVNYDTIDNQLSPNDGYILTLNTSRSDKRLQSDYDFFRTKASLYSYNPLPSNLYLDLRLEGETLSTNETDLSPFVFPTINARGVPVMRYQGQNSFMSELQLSWEFQPRWRVLGFLGAHKVFGSNPFFQKETTSFKEADYIYSQGIGFRYLIAKKFGLRMGIDIAKSKDEKALYIQFGTAWKGL